MDHNKRAKANKAATRLPPEEDPEFQIAPMIDILLVLLVFFMSITSTEVLAKNQEVNLPVAKDANPPPQVQSGSGTITVNLIYKTGLYIDVDGKGKEIGELRKMVSDKVLSLQGDALKVIIRADRETPYSYVKEVMKAVAGSGVNSVTFSVTDKENPNTAKPAP
jgi:biopolymer transport protein ExbD